MKRAVGRAAAHVLVPLFIGGAIYIGGRTTALAMWAWARAVGVESTGIALREATVWINASPEWVRFSLPDALWVYALTYSVVALQRGSSTLVRSAYFVVPVAFGPGAELAQALGWLPGTFDAMDLIFCAAALALGWFTASSPDGSRDATTLADATG